MLHMLFVDDKPDQIKNQMVTHFPDFEIEFLTNGLKTLELIESFKPDVLVLDMNLGRIHGLEVAAKIRDKYPSLPFLFLTKRSEPEMQLEAYQKYHPHTYIVKAPYWPSFKLQVQRLVELIESKGSKKSAENTVLHVAGEEETLLTDAGAIFCLDKELAGSITEHKPKVILVSSILDDEKAAYDIINQYRQEYCSLVLSLQYSAVGSPKFLKKPAASLKLGADDFIHMSAASLEYLKARIASGLANNDS